MSLVVAADATAGPKPFLAKLYQMVDEEETADIVGWTQAGDGLVVKDPEQFAQKLLPLHFKHSNFSSFVRQLNTYGFSKVDPDSWIFGHVHFRKGQYDDLRLIQRKSSHRPVTNKGGAAASSATNPPQPFDSAEASAQEAALRAEIQSLRTSHDNMSARIKSLSGELLATREQQQNTRHSITKIFSFLTQVYHAHSSQQGQQGLTPPGMPLSLPPPTDSSQGATLSGLQLPAEADPLGPGSGARPMKRARIDEEGEAGDIPSSPQPPMPAPMRSLSQRSLGAEAALALPDHLQDAALQLVGSTDLQDEALSKVLAVQRTTSGVGSEMDSINSEDLEGFLWDFIETNQDQVEERASQPQSQSQSQEPHPPE